MNTDKNKSADIDGEMVRYKGTTRKCLPVDADDVATIVNMAIDSSVMRKGRPCNYPNNQQGLDMFVQGTIDYFRYINEVNANPEFERKLIPDIEIWAMYIGITRVTIFNYEQRGGDWTDTIKYYKNAIASVKKQLMMNYKIPPMIAVFDMANNHDYINTSEFKLVTKVEDKEQEQRDTILEQSMDDMGLVWDADKGEYVPRG